MIRKLLIALVASVFFSGSAVAQNYSATAGSGLTFGSKLVAAVQYPQGLICDPTTPSQCIAVSSSGFITVNLASGSTIAATQSGTWNVGLSSGSNTIGAISNTTFAATQSGTWTVQPGNTANTTPWIFTPYQGGSVLSATNGLYTNILQGNAALSSGNPLPVTAENANANGQAAMAASSPIVIASNQSVSNANASVAINVSTATTTQLVALSGTTKIYVTAWDVIAAGTGNVTLEYGTGTACATGTTVLTGAYNLVAQAGISKGDGSAPVLVVPSGNALCILTSAAVQMSGSLTYQQF